jgi:hypothetical protein
MGLIREQAGDVLAGHEDTIVATMCAAGLPIEVVHDARGDRP